MDPLLQRALAEAAGPFSRRDPLAMAAASKGAKPGTPTFQIRLEAPLDDGRYGALRLAAATGPGGGAFAASTARFDQRTGSGQIYEWFHRAPANILTVGAETRRAHLVIDTNLAGADLRFRPTGDTRSLFPCVFTFPSTGPPEIWKETTTRGTLTGSFSFTPNEQFFATTASDVRAVVTRDIRTGRPCGNIGGGRVYCPRQWSFAFGQPGTHVYASKYPTDRPADLFAYRIIGGSTNYEVQLIGAFSPSGDPVTRSSRRVIVDANGVGPFLGGRITFHRTQQLPRGRVCRAYVARHAFEWSSGSVDLRFDAGPIHLTGPGLVARSRLLFHHLP